MACSTWVGVRPAAFNLTNERDVDGALRSHRVLGGKLRRHVRGDAAQTHVKDIAAADDRNAGLVSVAVVKG